ncbi:MAG: hypothetical protein ABJB16_14145 [Saprospiraceae bacterium]
MKKRKIDYITYIEDTKKHHKLIGLAAKEGTQKAVRKSRQSEVSITYVDGVNIIKEFPSGRMRILGTIVSGRKVKVGTKEKIS